MDFEDEYYYGDSETNCYTNRNIKCDLIDKQEKYNNAWLNNHTLMSTIRHANTIPVVPDYGRITDVNYKHDKLHNAELNNKSNFNDSIIGLPNEENNNTVNVQMRPLKDTSASMDDLRISKLLRRLLAEENIDNAIELCKKLDIAVHNQNNASYICRSFDYLFDTMVGIFKQCPHECLPRASEILGIMAYINRSDYGTYNMHLTKAYKKYPNIRKYLIWSIKKSISCDVNLNLMVHSKRLLYLLWKCLEDCDKADIFMAITETMAEFSRHYVKSFEHHFSDIVDIIIGWLLESEQTSQFKRYCTKILQEFSTFFVKQLQFTCNLLGQFIEDLNACNDKISLADDSLNVKKETGQRIAAFIGAFSAIIKALCVKQYCVQLTQNAEAILGNAFMSIRRSAELSLINYNDVLISEDYIVNLNEYLCLMVLTNNIEIVTVTNIEILLKLQFQYFELFNIAQQCSVLYVAWTVITQLKTKVPLTFIDLIMSVRSNVNDMKENPMQEVKVNSNSKTYKLLLKIYQEIIKIKNVPLLQRAYHHIINDIDSTINNLQNANPMTTTIKWETLLHFYLNALTALTTQSYSIISMYALQPSILELLIHNCQAANQEFWLRYITLHGSLLQLLVVYCYKNHNFRQTSRLLTQQLEPTSPSSENFSIILRFLASILRWSNMSTITSQLIIDWLAQILQDCQHQYDILIKDNTFLDVCKGITLEATNQPNLYSKLLLILLKYPKLPQIVLIDIRDVAFCMIDSTDNNISSVYCKILAKIPIYTCMQSYGKCDQQLFPKYKVNMYTLCQIERNALPAASLSSSSWSSSPSYSYCNLFSNFVKLFVENLNTCNVGQCTNFESTSSSQITSISLPSHNIYFKKRFLPYAAYTENQNNENFMKLIEILNKHWSILANHLQYENAKHCIQQRLRTYLGKPQETLFTFENIILKYAQQLSPHKGERNASSNVYNIIQAIDLQHNCQMIFGFLDNLEKHIYNAANGTAYAMQLANKQVKTFFRINNSTCNDWFKRIHTSINTIALHSLQPELTIRLSETILCTESVQANLMVMDRSIIIYLRALLDCAETDVIRGLHIWLKVKFNNRYDWIEYVAEQCCGHLEQALSGYRNALQKNAVHNCDTSVEQFLQEQLTECLYHTARWSEIPQITGNNQKPLSSPLSMLYTKDQLDLMESLYKDYFNNTNNNGIIIKNIMQLTDWEDLEIKEHNNTILCPIINSCSWNDIIMKLKTACIHEAFTNKISNEAHNSSLSTLKLIIERGVREAFITGCEPTKYNKHFFDLLILNNVCDKLSIDNDKYNVNDEEKQEVNDRHYVLPTLIASKQLMWSLITTQRYNKRITLDNKISRMFLNTAISARMEGNILYCQSLLERFFVLKGYNSNLNTIINQIMNSELRFDLTDNDMLRGVTELAKCVYTNANMKMDTKSNSLNDAIELQSSCCNQILQLTRTSNYAATNECCEMFITVADWLVNAQRSNHYNNSVKEIQFQHLINQLPELNICCNITQSQRDGNVHGQPSLSQKDYNIGKLLQASILIKNDCGNAWLSFGNWCYRWGRKLMESRSKLSETTDVETTSLGKLSEHDISLIRDELKSDFTSHTIDEIINCLHSYLMKSFNDNGSAEDIYNDANSSIIDILNNDIKKIANLSEKQLHTINGIWSQAHKSVYGLYKEATRAYFKYLNIQSGRNLVTSTGALVTTELTTTAEESTLVNITLRILRLIVKHAAGLQEVLEEGLSNTPLLPWRIIVPQLFSRLNHHEPYVRRCVSELLCHLSSIQPQLIIFPAVVGAQQELRHRKSNEGKMLFNCFESLCSKLAEQAPHTVRHVELLVKELRRIAVLWEEYWLYSLGHLYAEYLPVFNALESDAKKEYNGTLANKCDVFLKHLSKDFELIAQTTSKEPETNYEKIFQDRFKYHINNILLELQKPYNLEQCRGCFAKIKQLYGLFQQRPLRGNASTMKVHDVSPVLACLDNTDIAMPGVDADVRIKSVDNFIYILPTKTKPKKVAFYGCDGQRYTYLFKGQEDLHLDERIMQFLSISNSMMARSQFDNWLKADYFRAQHYSVIPLGSRSGFISWVDGCVPLFGIYKKWQQRDALVKLQHKSRQQNDETLGEPSLNMPNAPRPFDLFYEKLQPLLAENNLKVTDPRKQWPIQVLKTVLRQLTKETPSDLISKEIWCSAMNIVDWHKSVRRYTISVAVMSIIGYVIGLGDRHLDNILIKLSTGEIVHIDYNVCFERGKTLKVPEKVPCRLTPNIVKAFGLTHIEGPFRLSCEYVLKILRKERETLLTLLEAFVYDPLVDWAVNTDGTTATSSRFTSAHTAALSIAAFDNHIVTTPRSSLKILQQRHKENVVCLKQNITGRCQEFEPLWMKFKTDLEEHLKEIDNHLEKYEINQKKLETLQLEYDDIDKQRNCLKELTLKNVTDIEWQQIQTALKLYDNYKKKREIFKETYENLCRINENYNEMLNVYNDEIANLENLIQKAIFSHNCETSDMSFSFKNSCNIMTMETMNEELMNEIQSIECQYGENIKVYLETAKQCLRILLQYRSIKNFNYHPYHVQFASNSIQEFPKNSKLILEQHHRKYFNKLIVIYEYLNSEYKSIYEQKQQQHQQNLKNASIEYIEGLSFQCTSKYTEMISTYDKNDVINYVLSVLLPDILNYAVNGLKEFLKQSKSICTLKLHIYIFEILENLLKFIFSSIHCSIKCDSFHLILKCLVSLQEACQILETLAEKLFSHFIMNRGDNEFDVDNADDIIAMLSQRNHNLTILMDNFKRYLNEFIIDIKCLQQNILKKLMTNKYKKNFSNEADITDTCKMNVEEFIKTIFNNALKQSVKLIKSYSNSMINNHLEKTIIETEPIVYDIRNVHHIIFNIIDEIENNLMITLTQSSLILLNDNDHPNMIAKSNCSVQQDLHRNKLFTNLYEEFCVKYQSCYLEKSLEYVSHLLQQHVLIMSSYYWNKEHILSDMLLPDYNIVIKSQMMQNVNVLLSKISTYEMYLINAFTRLETYANYINDVNESNASGNTHNRIQQYETLHNNYKNFSDIFSRLKECCNTLLQVESSIATDVYMVTVKEVEKTYNDLNEAEMKITPVERNLVELLDTGNSLDHDWIKNSLHTLEDIINNKERIMNDLKSERENCKQAINNNGQYLENLFHRLVGLELRSFLKVITKCIKQIDKEDSDAITLDIRNLHQTSKSMQTILTSLHYLLISPDIDIQMIKEKLKALHVIIRKVDDKLLLLITPYMQQEHQDNNGKSPLNYSPNQQQYLEKPTAAVNYQIEQKRNAYAVSVWKRIRMKLEGRDPDPNCRSTVHEQVDFVIREALNENNLASLYEGWTPWV